MLQTLSSEPTKGNLERHKCECERFIPSHSHFDKCVFESIDHVPPNIPYSSHSTHVHIFEDRCAVIQIINNGWHVTRTQRVDLDGLFERMNLDHSTIFFKKACEHSMQWHALLTLWQLR